MNKVNLKLNQIKKSVNINLCLRGDDPQRVKWSFC